MKKPGFITILLRAVAVFILSFVIAAVSSGCITAPERKENYTVYSDYDLSLPSVPTFTIRPVPKISAIPTVSLAPIPSLSPPNLPGVKPSADSQSGIKILSVTSPVAPDAYATVVIRGEPGTLYNISVIYYSGPSKASGLYPKTAGDDGSLSWTWHIGPNTRAGDWEIIISGGGDKTKTTFTVTG